MHTKFQSVNLREKYHMGDLGIHWRIILKLIFKKYGVVVWTRFNWLRTRSGGGL